MFCYDMFEYIYCKLCIRSCIIVVIVVVVPVKALIISTLCDILGFFFLDI